MMDRISVCAAYYIVASRWHSGQSSKGYAILSRLSRMGFRPSPLIDAKGSEARNNAAALLWNRRAEIRRDW